MKKYSTSHEWIMLEKEVGVVGVSDHAQKELGEVVYVELPEVGKEIKQGEEVAVIESTKAAADVYAPTSGTVVAVNHLLVDSPEKINQDAEGDGWLFKLEVRDLSLIENLMESSAYSAMIEG